MNVLNSKRILVLTLLISAFDAFSGTKLLDLMKAKKHAFAVSPSCLKFIQSADHTTLKNTRIQNAMSSLSSLNYKSDYYYHYSNDMGDHLKNAVRKKDFSEIISFLLSYSGALENVAGPGFYIAANPFSSADYGQSQVIVKIESDAKIFNYELKSAEFNAALREEVIQSPGLAACTDKLALSLIMSENDVDIIYYNDAYEWSVVLNEDVIKDSRMNLINSQDKNTIIKKMVTQNNTDTLIGQVKEINPKRPMGFTLQQLMNNFPAAAKDDNKIITLSNLIPTWDQSMVDTFSSIVALSTQPTLDQLMKHFSAGKIPLSTYDTLDLSKTSKDFRAWMGKRVLNNGALTKKWTDTLYASNMLTLMVDGILKIEDYFDNVTTSKQIADFFNYRKSLGYTMAISPQIIEGVFGSSLFKLMDTDSKFKVFNDYMSSSTPDRMARIIPVLSNAGYDLTASHKYILAKPNLFKSDMGTSFIQNYIMFKDDAALLDANTVKYLITQNASNLSDLVQYTLTNRAKFGASGDSLISQALTVMPHASITTLLSRINAGNFKEAEKNSYLTRLVSDSTVISALFRFYITTYASAFDLSTSDLMQKFDLNLGSATQVALKYLVAAIEKDSTLLTKFTDLTQSPMTIRILGLAKFSDVSLDLLSKYRGSLMKDYSVFPKLPASVEKVAFDPSKVGSIMSSYSKQDQWRVIRMVADNYRDQHLNLLNSLSFDAVSVNNILRNIQVDEPSFATYLALINNKDFVAYLDGPNFELIIKRLVLFSSPLDLKGLWASETVTFNKALSLYLNLTPTQDKYNLDYLKDEYLNFEKLATAEKLEFFDLYLRNYSTTSQYHQKLYWNEMKQYSKAQNKVPRIVEIYPLLKQTERNDLMEFYLETPAAFEDGLTVFKAQNLVLASEVILSKDKELLSRMLPYLEVNYPRTELLGYVDVLIKNYTDLTATKELRNHFEKFLCKKVNRYKALNALIKASSGPEKKYYKEQKSVLCKDDGNDDD